MQKKRACTLRADQSHNPPISSDLLHRAETYIAERAGMAEEKYRHTYHAMAPVGWMNDPNGFCYALGKYHVFHQFHPYATSWGPMHWGHYVSDDLIRWELLPPALAPDMPYDKDGCFSGSAMEKDGALYLLYTAVADGKQQQALARSLDGVRFEKLGIVIGEDDLPRDCSAADFRDPYVFCRGGKYYCLVGCKHADGDGAVLLYRSDDLVRWSYVGRAWKDGRTHSGIYECPAFASFGDTDALFVSPQFLESDGVQYENIHANMYLLGRLDLSTGEFHRTSEHEADGGFDFYAAQTAPPLPDGRIVMMAWMQMWDRSFPTAPYGWVGALTLPRELTFREGKLFQAPVREIERYRTDAVRCEEAEVDGTLRIDGIEGDTVELSFELDLGASARAGVKVFSGGGSETSIYYDRAKELVVFDRSRMGTLIKTAPCEHDSDVRHARIRAEGNVLQMRLFLDVSSCEVFLGGGEQVMTGNVYSEGKGIEFFSEGGRATVRRVEKYTISVPHGSPKL